MDFKAIVKLSEDPQCGSTAIVFFVATQESEKVALNFNDDWTLPTTIGPKAQTRRDKLVVRSRNCLE